METIDFTKPEAFTKFTTTTAATTATADASPGQEALYASPGSSAQASNPEGAQRFRRRLGSAIFWTLLMLLVWGAGAALLTLALQQAQPGAGALQWPPDGPQLLVNMQAPQIRERMLELAGMALDLVYIPVLAFAVFVWIPIPLSALIKRRKGGAAPGIGIGIGIGIGMFEIPLLIVTFIKFAAIALCLVGAGYAAMAAIAFAEGDDPLEILVGVTPPYQSDFLARHPSLTPDGATLTK